LAISVHFKADPPCSIGAVWELIQHYNTKPKRWCNRKATF